MSVSVAAQERSLDLLLVAAARPHPEVTRGAALDLVERLPRHVGESGADRYEPDLNQAGDDRRRWSCLEGLLETGAGVPPRLRALDHLLFERLVELSQCFFCLLALADVDEGEYYAVDTVLGRAVQHYPHQVEVIVRSSHVTLYRRQ